MSLPLFLLFRPVAKLLRIIVFLACLKSFYLRVGILLFFLLLFRVLLLILFLMFLLALFRA